MIAIPNMDMSKSCTECPLEVIGISGYPRCVIVQEMVVDGNLFNRCPLIEIVECKDCKHSKEWYGDRRLCYLWSEVGVSVFESGYCNYGERRADDKTEESRP